MIGVAFCAMLQELEDAMDERGGISFFVFDRDFGDDRQSSYSPFRQRDPGRRQCAIWEHGRGQSPLTLTIGSVATR